MPHIYLKDVELIGQPTGDTCWLTAAEMIWTYFRTDGRKIIAIPSYDPVKEIENYQKSEEGKNLGTTLLNLWGQKKGIQPTDTHMLKYYGLTAVKPPANGLWTCSMIFHLLERFGPLWAGGEWSFGFKHAIAITGADTETQLIYYNDPDPMGKGSLKYWKETKMQALLAKSKGGTVMAFTNTQVNADDFDKGGLLITRFPVDDNPPQAIPG